MTERTSDYKLHNATFRVTYGDITQIVADALVSSDDNYLTMSGGVSGALLEAGGMVIRQDARKHSPLKLGDVIVTTAGSLPAKYVFHVVTIDFDYTTPPNEPHIRNAMLKCLQLADALGVRHIAFPALGTGVGGFPLELAAEVMIHTIANYLVGETCLEMVTLALYSSKMTAEASLNLFCERATALVSISTQSKRLSELLTELQGITRQMQQPELAAQALELQSKLSQAQTALADSPANLESLNKLEKRTGIARLSRQVVEISVKTQKALTQDNQQLEVYLLNTRLSGLYNQLNIHYANLNELEIDKANYGPLNVPLHIKNAIKNLKDEIKETETQINEIKGQLAVLA